VKKELQEIEEEYTKQRGTLTDADFEELSERLRLEAVHKVAVNAPKKEAQRQLDSWKNKHMGPKWELGHKIMPLLERLKKTIALKKEDITSLDSVDSIVEPRVYFLAKAGFLKDVSDLNNVTKDNLTLRGILATEVNECHSLLTAELYAQGLLKESNAKLILTVLSTFINEKTDDDAPSLKDLNIPAEAVDILKTIDNISNMFQKMETSCGIFDDGYWATNLTCVEPVWCWLHGESSSVICNDYGLYEGNLMRMILRVANIADEWISLATYCEDTEMVTKMTEAKVGLLRDIAVTDSLYLRI
jgi:superfamily II RNA helicase